MVLLLAASMVGATVTFVLLSSYGLLVAFIATPFGASAFVAIVAFSVAMRRRDREDRTESDFSTEAVASLRKASGLLQAADAIAPERLAKSRKAR